MTDDKPPSPNGPSWLDRFAKVLLGEPRDTEQLIELLRDSMGRGLLDADALRMIEGALQVSKMAVSDVMIPRSQAVMLERSGSYDEIIGTVVKSAHSRFPVLGDSHNEVVGILLAKDILAFMDANPNDDLPVGELMRPPAFIPESKRLNVLLKEFRASRKHMAIVVDEYGSVSGLITIEDVLEQIVGDIDDEHDPDTSESFIDADIDGSFNVQAAITLNDFNQYFEVTLSSEGVLTLGGFIVNTQGHVPETDDELEVSGMLFRIIESEAGRIKQVKISRVEASKESTELDESTIP